MSSEPNVEETPPSKVEKRPSGALRVTASVLGLVVALIAFGGRCGVLKKSVGERSTRAEDCRSGLLRTMGEGVISGICTEKCKSDGECGTPFRCLDGACTPKGTKKLGESCSAHWDCEGGRCIVPMKLRDVLGGGRSWGFICSQPCGSEESCPSGYHCSMSVDENGLTCWPDGTPPGASREGHDAL